MNDVLAIIMGGGKGTRLFPLTKDRAKPAVPFGGKYRLVDIPISNCINSGFRSIYVLTQFNSTSLHVHISQTYQFDAYSRGFVEILAAQQTLSHSGWYEGTADAVRKNFIHFRNQSPSDYLILSGDQLYRMDLEDFLHKHRESGADITVAGTPVTKEKTPDLGIVQMDKNLKIKEFVEKPPVEQDISALAIPHFLKNSADSSANQEFLASMGIYLFKAEVLEKALDNYLADFGKEVVPQSVKSMDVRAYIFNGFWEDIGTIKSFYETSIDLASVDPHFNFYDEERPIYTHKRYLPSSKFNYSKLSQTLAADGCIVSNAQIENSVIGIRTKIEWGAELSGVICMGADFYETAAETQKNRSKGIPDIGIGKNTKIRKAIIDKNARIGGNCSIGMEGGKREDGDYAGYYIRDGIIIIPKNAVIPAGSSI